MALEQAAGSLEFEKAKLSGVRIPPAIEALIISAITTALIIPCYWQDHIEAGDLSSHLYNAWLAIQIKRGTLQGLSLAPMWNNALCDWILEALIRLRGVILAERIVVGVSVLVFFWGAFCLMRAATGRKPWAFLPILFMLTYGLVLHMGFLNFYLSSGLCLWIIAILWDFKVQRLIVCIPIAALALLAHALPVAWAAAVLIYVHLYRRVPPKFRFLVFLAGLGAVGAVAALVRLFPFRSTWDQFNAISNVASLTGVEQVWLYGRKYLIVAAGLLFVWAAMLLERVDKGKLWPDPLFQLWILHVSAVALLPSAVQLPQYAAPLAMIEQRLSFFTALCFCMMIGTGAYSRLIFRFSVVVAMVFFAFLYTDSSVYNRVERDLSQVLDPMPRGQPVIAHIEESGSRLNPLGHMLDRVCIGHCFDYGNYEAPSRAFRVRVQGPNRVVTTSSSTVAAIESGEYVVTPAEAPLYSICPSQKPGELFQLRLLHAGEKVCHVSIDASPRLW